MDERPFRMQRPSDTRGSGQPRRAPSPAPKPEPEQEPISEPERPKPRSVEPAQEPKVKKSRKRWLLPVVVLAVIVLGAIGWLLWQNVGSSASGIIDSNKYQAVSTVDGQVYFGKVVSVSGDYVKLTDAYYLQTQIATQSENEDEITQDNVEVVKLNNKVYSPEDEIVIPKHQVLSYENLQPGSQVADFIQENRGDSIGN